MKRSYYFDHGSIKKVSSKINHTKIDDAGTGWIYADLDGMVKPELQKTAGQWQIVETATPEEVEEFNKDKQRAYIDQLNEKFKQDGIAYQREIKNKVTAQLVGRADAVPIMREINNTVYVLLDKIAKGDWALAMLDYQDNNNNPTIPEVVDLFNEVGQKAIEYYQNEYPH